MYKLNFNIPLKNIDGSDAEGQTLCQTLAQVLGMMVEGKTLQIFGWYKSMQVNEEIVLNDEELKTLRKIIESSDRVYLFAKVQLLDVINNTQ